MLFDFVLVRYAETRYPGDRRSDGYRQLVSNTRFLRSPALIAAFKNYASQNRPLVTVAGVVVELEYLFRRFRRKGHWTKAEHGPFWTVVLDEWRNAQTKEELVPATALPVDVVQAYGPVDASLVALAEQYAARHEPAEVVTFDGNLHDHCLARNVGVRWIERVLSEVVRTTV